MPKWTGRQNVHKTAIDRVRDADRHKDKQTNKQTHRKTKTN